MSSALVQVPTGTAVLSDKFRGTELHTTLKGALKVHLEEVPGCADVYTAGAACVFLPESEVINLSPSIRERLTALSKYRCQGIVLAECTTLSKQYIGSLQEVATFQFTLVTIPVQSLASAAHYIIQIVRQQCRPDGGALPAPQPPSVDNALLLAVQALPKTGSKKAKLLLSKFESLRKISEASVEDLSAVVGRASAEAIHTHFHRPLAAS